MLALYGKRITARLVTRVLVVLQLVFGVAAFVLTASYGDALLPRNLVAIRNELWSSYDSNSWQYYAMQAGGGLILVGLVGLFLMKVWARWLFTVSWVLSQVVWALDLSAITITAGVLRTPFTLGDAASGAILAVVWTNAWSDAARGTAADSADVESSQ